MATSLISARRVAAIYDIHPHLSALEAVLAEIQECEVDRIVGGGDAVTRFDSFIDNKDLMSGTAQLESVSK